MTGTLRVCCAEYELAEDGIIVLLGESLRRVATPQRGRWLGTELDEVPWRFDQYAEYVGDPVSLIGGTVTAIEAIYARLTCDGTSGTWRPALGSAWTEALASTARTRRPFERIDWQQPIAPGADGVEYGIGYPVYEEGDETLVGWVFTLEDVTVIDPSSAS